MAEMPDHGSHPDPFGDDRAATAPPDRPLLDRPLEVRRLGSVPYGEALCIQEELVARRRSNDLPDQLLLLEHPHVITLGSGTKAGHVLADAERRRALGVELWDTGRGGDVTYHGPGQLVGYPVLDLKPDRKDVHGYLRDLEEVILRVLTSYRLEGTRMDGFTGVWIGPRKVAAIGVRVSSGWITSHGFALNVSPDLSYFDTIIPCGLAGRDVTSLARELGSTVPLDQVMTRTVHAFGRVFGRQIVEVPGPLNLETDRGARTP